METNVDTRRNFVSWTSDIGKFGYLKFSAQSVAAWLFLFSLNTFETEKDQVIAFATTDCLWSAECTCLFNVLAFQFLHSLPVITLLFLCFTHNLQLSHKIEFWFKVKSFILIHTRSTTFGEKYGLLNFTLYWQTVYFHFHFCEGWGGDSFWFLGLLVCCLVW